MENEIINTTLPGSDSRIRISYYRVNISHLPRPEGRSL